MSGFSKRYSSFDRFQQRHRWLGFPLAVLQKYADDQGGYLAASITYYAFFAVFSLLLVLTTVLGFVLGGHRHLYRSILDSALGQFPVIGPELSRGSLHGSGLALGLAIALIAGAAGLSGFFPVAAVVLIPTAIVSKAGSEEFWPGWLGWAVAALAVFGIGHVL